MADGRFARVVLRVRAKTSVGQSIRLSGGAMCLGMFSPSSAVRLVTTPETYPVWQTEHPLLLPRGIWLRYKYCLFEGEQFVSWEGRSGEEETDAPTDADKNKEEKVSEEDEGRELFVEDEEDLVVEDIYLTSSVGNHKQQQATGTPSSVIKRSPSGSRPMPAPVPAQPVPLQSASSTSSSGSGSGIKGTQGSATNLMHQSSTGSSSSFLSPHPISSRTDMRRLYEFAPQADDGLHGVALGDSSLYGRRLFVLCYHLPVRVTRASESQSGMWQAKWVDSLIAKQEGSLSSEMDVWWIGVFWSSLDEALSEQDQRDISDLLRPMNCIPVFLDPDVTRDHYQGFCKQILWPVFHNVDMLDLCSASWTQPGGGLDPGTALDAQKVDYWWRAFRMVNQAFADIIGPLLQADDILWIHDYHLCLCPKLIDSFEQRVHGQRRVRMVFFLHIPFPTSQIFRSLATGNEILEGMVCADVVGFHAFDHARHFLNACKRLLGLSHHSRKGLIGVQHKGRSVMVAISHVSIEVSKLEAHLALDAVQQEAQAYAERFRGKVVIAGVAVLQRLSGLSHKIAAYERFLEQFPNWRDKVVLVQKALATTNRLADQAVTTREVRRGVDRIKQRFGNHVIDFEEVAGDALPLPRRLALWRSSNILLLTAIREGLNPMPMEFVYARKDMEEAGVVIASEFSATASLLNGAIMVNPFEPADVATAIDTALLMPTAEKAARRARDMPFVTGRPVSHWTRQVLADMWALEQGTHEDSRRALAEGGQATYITDGKRRVMRSGSGDTGDQGGGRSMEEATAGTDTADSPAAGPGESAASAGSTTPASAKHGRGGGGVGEADGGVESKASDKSHRRQRSGANDLVTDVDAYTVCAYSMLDRGFELSVPVVTNVFAGARRRLLIFDYGGTLIPKERFGIYMKRHMSAISDRRPSQAVMDGIRALASDERNIVLIVTGLTKKKLLSLFGDLPNVCLAASNGLLYSLGNGVQQSFSAAQATGAAPCAVARQLGPDQDCGCTVSGTSASGAGMDAIEIDSMSTSEPVGRVHRDDEHEGDGGPVELAYSSHEAEHTMRVERIWHAMDFNVDWNAVKEVAIPVLEKFTARTNGSSISVREPGIGWSYFGSDPDWGMMQAEQLAVELEEKLFNFDVRVHNLKGMVELVPRSLHKGRVVEELLSILHKSGDEAPPDFVLAIGDDASDDYMYQSVYNFYAHGQAMHERHHVPPPVPLPHNREHADNDLEHDHVHGLGHPEHGYRRDGASPHSQKHDHGPSASDATRGPNAGANQLPPLPRIFTGTVGKKPTYACLYMNSVAQVQELISSLSASCRGVPYNAPTTVNTPGAVHGVLNPNSSFVATPVMNSPATSAGTAAAGATTASGTPSGT